MTKKRNDFYDRMLLPLLLLDDIDNNSETSGNTRDGSIRFLLILFIIVLSIICCISQLL